MQINYLDWENESIQSRKCIKCKECEKQCPQHIEITELLKDVANTFE